MTGAIVIPLLVFVIPIHFGALLVVLGVMTFMGVTNHMGWEIFPARLVRGAAGRWLITASHHHRHHEQYGCNYGLYFRIWDRLCGTDKGVGAFARGSGRARGGALGGFGGAADRGHPEHAEHERAGAHLSHPQP
jgi:sterol desaturase/sphingolipid hydroxylase (fatty acid hydroxylase superfamily)